MNEDSRSVLARYVEARTPEAARSQAAWEGIERRLASGDQGPSLPEDPIADGGSAATLGKALLVGVVVAGGMLAAMMAAGDDEAGAVVVSEPAEVAPVEPPNVSPGAEAGSSAGPNPSSPMVVTPASPAIDADAAVEAAGERAPPKPSPRKTKRKVRGQPAAGGEEAEDEPRVDDASSLAEEMKLLARGQRALKQGDTKEALRAFDEHARRFPRGSLTDERRVQRARALCALGRRDEARAAAKAFVRDSPGSPHAGKASRICREAGE